TLALYRKQKRLVGVVEEQVTATETYSRQMIDILGNIVEFRNGESNLHIHNVQTITRILLERVAELTNKYDLTNKKIMLISTASALHDIGKIAIDENVLNKPGKLTPEEFELVKTHSAIGANMIKAMPEFKQSVNDDNGIYKYAYEICRWHHERWNGFGYPDGLKGEEIPISAQAVAMADVYDALTSERCYKPAFKHTEAVKMILDGECGVFNPLLYNCLRDTADYIHSAVHGKEKSLNEDSMAFKVTKELIADKVYSQDSDKKYLLSFESAKRKFFSKGIKEIQVEYDIDYGMITISDYGTKFLHLDSSTVDIKTVRDITAKNGNFDKLMSLINRTTPSFPSVQEKIYLKNDGKRYLCEVKIMTLWDGDNILKRKSIVMRIIPNNSFESFGVTDTKNYNDEEFEIFVEQMKKVFDVVRVVDPAETEVIGGRDFDKSVKDSEKTGVLKCYSIWGKNERCQNCISYKALKTKTTQSKLEFLNDSVYQIFSKYTEVDGKPKIVEMVYQNKEDLLLDAYGKNEFIDYVNSYNRRLYRDSLTGAYNRRYFEEVGRHFSDVAGVGMVDVDNFKAINDRFGHVIGDKAICAVADTIEHSIGKRDKFIRYGGDEFVLLFVDMSRDEFDRAIAKIVEAVNKTKIAEIPDAELSVTVGGVYGINNMETAITEADRLMYKGKTEHEHIVTENIKENGEN
ncbi:MAG: diguanylate cyclase, partial [Clostridia bacterium]|nr:diguanylate cyclase [Clostridia bacterium]